ncbi:efflux RND transporter periplasmic adaptor subunit [Campylobacter portucalensis]|nr:efflux RND transporter periplasmic adaptor subunit [Campylobacter portucalensis]
MKKNVKFTVFLSVILVVGFSFYYNLNKNIDTKYLTTKPIRGDLTNSVVVAGQIWARDLVDIGTQVSGEVQKLYVKIGDSVKKGDFIAKIDSIKQKNEVEKKKAENQILMADLNASKISFKIAKQKYEREQNLYKKGASSKENLENALNNLTLKKAKIEQLKAQIYQNKIDLDTAMRNLDLTNIKAPFDGTIVSIIAKEGQTLNANQTTPIIAQIADLSKLEINMQIPEGDLPKIKVGMSVKYSILSDPDLKFDGDIVKIDPALSDLSDGKYAKHGMQNIQSSGAIYYYAKMFIKNQENLFKIGMTTQNEIIISQSKDILYIPQNAIFRENNKSFVKILKDGNVLKQYVNLGISDGIYVEVDNINENDDIILQNDESNKSKS